MRKVCAPSQRFTFRMFAFCSICTENSGLDEQGDCEKSDLMPVSSIRYLILDCSSVTHMDSAGVRGLAGLHGSLLRCGIGFCLCNPSEAVVAIMDRAGLTDQLGALLSSVMHAEDLLCPRWLESQPA